jgi:hypothetical protein
MSIMISLLTEQNMKLKRIMISSNNLKYVNSITSMNKRLMSGNIGYSKWNLPERPTKQSNKLYHRQAE